jgi:3-oxoacyl-[acyl-carrier-protein] synthase-3
MDIMFGGVLEDVLPKADILRLGARTGHLGGGDVIANLADVRTAADLAPGDIAVITGGGSGFTWTTVLVEVPDPATG